MQQGVTEAAILLNSLMPGGNKKGHTYLNKSAAFSCSFV